MKADTTRTTAAAKPAKATKKTPASKSVGVPATQSTTKQAYEDLRNYINRMDWSRIKADVKTIMDSIAEAEAWRPFRVKMQKVFDQTTLHDQVWSVMERRKELTLLRKYELYDPASNMPDKVWSEYLQAEWCKLLNSYALDAEWFGYQLIALGDIIDSKFPNLGIVDRRKINPDTKIVSRFDYGMTGYNFQDAEVSPWHIWVSTPTENGRSNVGYGLLIRIAILEILARNNRTRNADYNELYGSPTRVGKTDKTDEGERMAFFEMMVKMGSLGAILLDANDNEAIELTEANTGTGFQTYANFEERIHKGINKLGLGHGDALESTPGKLGSEQGEDNPIVAAMMAKQVKDGERITALWNDQILGKLRNIGIPIPQHLRYRFLNDEEKAATREREDESNTKTAELFKTIKEAGGSPDWAQFSERTGLKVEKAEPPAPLVPPGAQKPDEEQPPEKEEPKTINPSKELTARMRNKLNKIYNNHNH